MAQNFVVAVDIKAEFTLLLRSEGLNGAILREILRFVGLYFL